MESLATVSVARTELVPPVFRLVDSHDFFPFDDFFAGDVRVTVVDDDVTSVVAASVSTEGVTTCVAADEAAVVSAADCAGRLQPAAKATAANAPARDALVIDRFPAWSEALWVCAAVLSPTLAEQEPEQRRFPEREC
jgi:hypothetical protein